MEKIEVQEYGLFTFLMKVQELFEQGYRFDFEKNENVPTSYGTLLVANMFRKLEEKPVVVDEQVPSETPEVQTEETAVVARKTAKVGKA